MRRSLFHFALACVAAAACLLLRAAEESIASPGGEVTVTTNDTDTPLTLKIPLKFLGAGKLRALADATESAPPPEKIPETMRAVSGADTLELTFAAAGGYAVALSPL